MEFWVPYNSGYSILSFPLPSGCGFLFHGEIEHTFFNAETILLNSGVHWRIVSIVLSTLSYRLLHSLSFLEWCLRITTTRKKLEMSLWSSTLVYKHRKWKIYPVDLQNSGDILQKAKVLRCQQMESIKSVNVDIKGQYYLSIH